MACTDAGLTLTGTALLDYTVNGRPSRRAGSPDSNHSSSPAMAPHGIYPCRGDDEWIGIACRSDDDWRRLAAKIGAGWARGASLATLNDRLAAQAPLDANVAAWTRGFEKYALARELQAAGVPAAAVAKPEERIDRDPNTAEWGLWPTAHHAKLGNVRVDGLPVHLSKTDWKIARGGPCLGEHTEEVLGKLLGMSPDDVAKLRAEGVV
jgi:benzylsuccinate CoA-transferase BbsF subunit